MNDKERLELVKKGICPSCGKGKLSPTGRSWRAEEVVGPGKTRPSQNMREFECDSCGIKHVNIGLNEYIETTSSVTAEGG